MTDRNAIWAMRRRRRTARPRAEVTPSLASFAASRPVPKRPSASPQAPAERTKRTAMPSCPWLPPPEEPSSQARASAADMAASKLAQMVVDQRNGK